MTRRDLQRSNAPAPRGLTLLEVLAATIMLAILAATCSPIIAKAMALVRQNHASSSASSSVTLSDLGEVADAFMADPKRFGVTNPKVHAIELVEFVCPSSLDEGASASLPLSGRIVRVARLAATESDAKHVWLMFQCEQSKVVRWVAWPDEPTSEQRKGAPS